MRSLLAIALLLAAGQAAAGQDFACMQACYQQGHDRGYCTAMCNTGGGLQDQPGLPRNPAFDQVKPTPPAQRPLPAVADPKCMKDCQQRGYNYMLCQKQCSYSMPGY